MLLSLMLQIAMKVAMRATRRAIRELREKPDSGADSTASAIVSGRSLIEVAFGRGRARTRVSSHSRSLPSSAGRASIGARFPRAGSRRRGEGQRRLPEHVAPAGGSAHVGIAEP